MTQPTKEEIYKEKTLSQHRQELKKKVEGLQEQYPDSCTQGFIDRLTNLLEERSKLNDK